MLLTEEAAVIVTSPGDEAIDPASRKLIRDLARSATVAFAVGNVIAKAHLRSLARGDGFDAGQVGHELAGIGARASATRRAARR